MKNYKSARKHSVKRDAILQVLQNTKSHPGAHWVFEQLRPAIPKLSLGTVYRNISVFLEEGVAASVGVVNGEERFDGRVDPHPHFICEQCGRVLDLPKAPHEENSSIWLKMPDYMIDKRKTVFYGLCSGCKNDA